MPSYADALFKSLISLGLQGRCREGLPIARNIPLDQLTPKKRRLVQNFINRFSMKRRVLKISKDPIRKLISIYEEYWHDALLNSKEHTRYERKLFRDITSWLKCIRGVKLKSPSHEAIANRLKKEIEALGYYCVTGTVAHLQELEIWKTQRKVTYFVNLPETTEKVTTILMSKFLTKGWVAYATMGLHYPGGWAKKEGLYCNTHAYNLQSEKFRVSYLGHEAQHYSDFKKFPQLSQVDLEYRAKLAEFALCKRTAKKMFQVYSSRADYNKKSPHAFSYFCAVRDLTIAMKGHDNFKLIAENPSSIKVSDINTSANLLLQQHSKALRTREAKKVSNFIS